MKYKLYAVYDKVAEVYNPPFVATTDTSAFRSLRQATENDPNKCDYELKKIADYDSETGLIDNCDVITVATFEEEYFERDEVMPDA